MSVWLGCVFFNSAVFYSGILPSIFKKYIFSYLLFCYKVSKNVYLKHTLPLKVNFDLGLKGM